MPSVVLQEHDKFQHLQRSEEKRRKASTKAPEAQPAAPAQAAAGEQQPGWVSSEEEEEAAPLQANGDGNGHACNGAGAYESAVHEKRH